MNEVQWFGTIMLSVLMVWTMFMATFYPERWKQVRENDWEEKKRLAGGLGKVILFGLSIYRGRK
ncbi:MAG: hypothetical protein KDA63_14530 [Planctomycetales bacterium]|nr:hypothetical protein [Planctomycetales bacterium]